MKIYLLFIIKFPMTSLIKDFFENNFIEICIKDSFNSINCIIGTSTLFFSVLTLLLNILALVKLIYFNGRINFETNLIIFSICQVFIIQLVIITSYEILIECFNLTQILVITLILRKLIMISNRNTKKNVLFILLNTINIISFIIYILFLFQDKKNSSYSFILIHAFLYAITSVILTFYSNSLVKIINKLEMKSSTESLVSLSSNSSSSSKEQIFYLMRKKQIKPLYIINFISSFMEFLLILSILLIPYNNFEQNQFKIMPNSSLAYIIYYLYLLICLFNISANFLCFFWKIRGQYKDENLNDDKNEKKIIDNKYIRRETIIMEKENPSQVNEFIENDNNKKEDPKKLEKSIYMSSFADISDEEKLDDEKNNEEINTEFLEALNKNCDRESIPSDINSKEGINRNTNFSSSKMGQEH